MTASMTGLEQRKLAMYDANIGPMTSLQALDRAIEFEQTAKACGPHDPAHHYMAQNQKSYETYAGLLEKAGR